MYVHIHAGVVCSFLFFFVQILKEWNTFWSPKFWMTDYSEPEMLAIQDVFPTCKIYLCDFHREQCWRRWIKDRGHGLSSSDGDLLLSLLQKLVFASASVDGRLNSEYIEAENPLKHSEVWKLNKKVRDWLEGLWLCIPEVKDIEYE